MEVARDVSLRESIKKLGKKVDKKALVASVGVMLMSWAALPVVYYLIVRRKKEEKEDVGEVR